MGDALVTGDDSKLDQKLIEKLNSPEGQAALAANLLLVVPELNDAFAQVYESVADMIDKAKAQGQGKAPEVQGICSTITDLGSQTNPMNKQQLVDAFHAVASKIPALQKPGMAEAYIAWLENSQERLEKGQAAAKNSCAVVMKPGP